MLHTGISTSAAGPDDDHSTHHCRGPGTQAGPRQVKLRSADGGELMTVDSLERDGDRLLIRGKVLGTMPLNAQLDAEAARAALKLLSPGLILFLLTLPFRRGRRP